VLYTFRVDDMMRKACTLLLPLSLVALVACDGIDLGASRRSNVRAGERSSDVTEAPAAASPAPAPAPLAAPASRWLHTRGASIVDASGAAVRLTGISWFGFETSTFAPHGLWERPLDAILDDVVALGYNMLRIPFATQMLDAGSTSNGIDFAQNPGLAGKKPIEVLDALVASAGARGLRIVLDRHRPDAAAQSALWYTAEYSEARWIDDWKMLAQRYAKDPTVIGFDLHNEPHGAATWGSGDQATDWRLAAERAGAAVQSVNPELLVVVEGVETVDGQGTWWGGNLRAAKRAPVRLPVANHVVYSPHEYPASVAPQPWLSAPDFPANLPAVWDETWGYLVAEDVAPVWIGELGTKYESAGDQAWLGALASYIARTQMSFAFWCLNPDSSTGGILKGDWQTTEASKQAIVTPILAPSLH
jgi:endoglucanase